MSRQPTVSTDSVAQDQIRAFVERILRMKEEAKAINDDIREIYAEAKGNGFDKTVLGQVVSFVEKRKKDPATLAERSALFDLYVAALDGGDEDDHETGTVVATHAHEATPPHDPVTGELIEDNEPATAPPTVGGPVEGVAPPASSATNFPVTVEGSSSTGGADVGGDGEAHSMPDKSGEGDAPSPAPGDGEPTNVVALPVRKPSDRPFSSSGLERPYGCLHVDACPKTWRDTEPCSMCRAAIAVEAGGTAVRHQGSIGQ